MEIIDPHHTSNFPLQLSLIYSPPQPKVSPMTNSIIPTISEELISYHSMTVASPVTGKVIGYTYMDDKMYINHSCMWETRIEAVMAGVAAGRIKL